MIGYTGTIEFPSGVGLVMAKRLAKPEVSARYRLDWDGEKVQAMDMAAGYVGLSVASFARLALELLIERKSVTLEEVRAEAQRLTSGATTNIDTGGVETENRPRGKLK